MEIINPFPVKTLINSVDFHPTSDLLCISYTHANRVVTYRRTQQVQILQNGLREPQHAIFTRDGTIIVVNWTNQAILFYSRNEKNDFYIDSPRIVPCHSSLQNYKPHGMSPSPCGKFFAIAYGCSCDYGKGIGIFDLNGQLLRLFDMQNGIPKGISYTPDGKALVVTFSDLNQLEVYQVDPLEVYQVDPLVPLQTITEGLSRPEDVKIKENICAVTNSGQNTVAFYSFDSGTNKIGKQINLLEGFCFPHGIAFSQVEPLMAVTNFGPIVITSADQITWSAQTSPKKSKTSLLFVENTA